LGRRNRGVEVPDDEAKYGPWGSPRGQPRMDSSVQHDQTLQKQTAPLRSSRPSGRGHRLGGGESGASPRLEPGAARTGPPTVSSPEPPPRSSCRAGQSQRRGSITKAGSPAMRAVLVQASWAALLSRRHRNDPIMVWAREVAPRTSWPHSRAISATQNASAPVSRITRLFGRHAR
jgi:hypothetical protein